MEKIRGNFLLFLLCVVLLLVFKIWFMPSFITGGDYWPSPYPQTFVNIPIFPYAWQWGQNGGLGGSTIGFLWFLTVSAIPTVLFGSLLQIRPEIVERLSFFYPYLILSSLSSFIVFRKLLNKSKFWILSAGIFMLNTYILMEIGRGQIFIFLSYAISPLVLYFFMQCFSQQSLRDRLNHALLAGLFLAFQVFVDIRIAYVTMVAVVVYSFVQLFFQTLQRQKNIWQQIFSNIFWIFFVPMLVAVLLHSFWLLPLLVFHQNPLHQLGASFTAAQTVSYLSFAKFEQTISLLYPYWPENIFGKVYFMRPEFLITPILAFSSLLFIRLKAQVKNKNFQNNSTIIYFSLLGLLGAFLAKGTNPPFGTVYLLLFQHVPGFEMFRDPTKWYVLIALSYSFLIPYSVVNIYSRLRTQSKFSIFKFSRLSGIPQSAGQFSTKFKFLNFQNLFVLVVIVYCLFLIKPALTGSLTGNLAAHQVPEDYKKLANFLSSEKKFSRTLWVPIAERYGFYSAQHPGISAFDIFSTNDFPKLFEKLNQPSAEGLLQDAGVKYVILPYDTEGEIYFTDRKYNKALYEKTRKNIEKVPWLTLVDCSIVKLLNCSGNPFGNIVVYEIQNPKDHFFFAGQSNGSINYAMIDPATFKLQLQHIQKGDRLVFSDFFDPDWEGKISNGNSMVIHSQKYEFFNSFILSENGNYTLVLHYKPQDVVNKSLVISIGSLLAILTALIFLYKKIGRTKI